MIRFVSASFPISSSFYAEVSGGFSASLISSSYTVIHSTIGTFDTNLTSSAIELILPSQSTGASNDINALVISSSDNSPSIGIGTSTPLTTLDIRSVTASTPANIILRTNEDGTIEVGEETGRVIFAIESASYLGTGFIASGSTAAIYSKVEGSSAAGAYGSLIFEVNDNLSVTEPVEALKLGYGADPNFSGVGALMSGSMLMTATAPVLTIKNSSTNYQIARLGWHSPTDQNDGQLLLFNQGNQSVKLNGDASPADASFIRYGNLALGATTAPERLTVTGNISASGALISSELTASGLNYPSTDGTGGQVIVTDGAGNLSFDIPDAEKVTFEVKNNESFTLPKGTPVHVTSMTGGTALVVAASASVASTMPAHGILNQQLTSGSDGVATILGQITGVNTSGFTAGDTVYVGPFGGYTNVKPTGSANLIQNLGIVKKVDASNGTGEIFGSGRSNDVPNIAEGYAWVGNSSGVATATATSSFTVTNASTASYLATSNTQLTTIAGPSDQLVELGNYPIGYDIVSAFPITGSGIIVSASTLASNHYNMIKVGDIELVDLKSLVNPNTFLIHNVDQFSITSGSDSGDIASANYLMAHTGQSFVVHNNGSNMLSINNGAVSFTTNTTQFTVQNSTGNISLLPAIGDIYIRANNEQTTTTASLHSVPVFSTDPSTTSGGFLKYLTASAFLPKFQVNGGTYLGQTAQRTLPFGSTTGESTLFTYTTTYMIPTKCTLLRVHTMCQSDAGNLTLKAYTIPATTADNTAISNGTLIKSVTVASHNAGDPFVFEFNTGSFEAGTKFGLTAESDTNPNGFRFTAFFREDL